jgi:type IV fimbrial biogenesis protein FimT
MRRRQATSRRGFTLVELLTTVVVLSVLLSYAIPSFTVFLQRTALNTQATALASALGTARAQAVSRNTWVTVAPAAGDWNNGWIVCVNPARLPDCSSGQTILLEHRQLPRNLAIAFEGTPDVGALSYSPVGYTRTLTDAMMSARVRLTLDDGGGTRLVDVSQLGRVRVCEPDTVQINACRT